MDPSESVQNEIDKIIRHLKDNVSIDDLNEDIDRLNRDIAEMKTTPHPSLVQNVDLLQQMISDYEGQFDGDIQLEMIQKFKHFS